MQGKTEQDVTLYSQSLASAGITHASFSYSNAWSVLDISLNMCNTPSYLQFTPLVASNSTVAIQLSQGQTGFTSFYRHIFYGVLHVATYPMAHVSNSSGPSAPVVLNDYRQAGTVLTLHIYFTMIAFVLMFPFGAILAMLRFQGWFKFHVGLQIAGSVVAFVGLALGEVNRDARQLPLFGSVHGIFGCALGVALLAQVGIATIVRPGQGNKPVQETWFASHKLLAGFLLLGGPSNCIVGTQRFLLTQGLTKSLLMDNLVDNTFVVNVIIILSSLSLGISSVAILGKNIYAFYLSRWSTAPTLPTKPPKKVKVLHNYTASDAKDLSVAAGTFVIVENTFDDGWSLVVNENNQDGLVPTSYLCDS